MRLQLSDGTSIEIRPANPSKRQVKRKGGALKRGNSLTSGNNVGGTKNTARAIYRNFEVNPDDPSDVVINRSSPEPTCVTVNPATRKYTWNVGGSCSTGYIGGRGV